MKFYYPLTAAFVLTIGCFAFAQETPEEETPAISDVRHEDAEPAADFVPDSLPPSAGVPMVVNPMVVPVASIAQTTRPVSFKSQPKLPQYVVEFAGGVAAEVNGKIITADDVKREIAPAVPMIRQESLSQADFDARIQRIAHETVQTLVDNILIIDEAKRQGLQLRDYAIKNEYNEFIIKNFNGDMTRFREFLKAQGKTDKTFKQDLENQMIVGFMRRQNQLSQAAVSPQKIKEYYEKNKQQFYQPEAVHLRQIMLPASQTDKATIILASLKEGVPFDELAKQYSQDDKRLEGGDWGWIERTEIRPELAAVAFSLEPKTYASDPVDLSGTLFIIYVEAKRPAGIQPLEDVGGQIEAILANQIAQQSYKQWIDGLRKKANINYYM